MCDKVIFCKTIILFGDNKEIKPLLAGCRSYRDEVQGSTNKTHKSKKIIGSGHKRE
jgi:hypothetical protein